VILGDANFISGTESYGGNNALECLLAEGNSNNNEFLSEVINWDTLNCIGRQDGRFLIDTSRSVFDLVGGTEYNTLTGKNFADGIIAGLGTGDLESRFDTLLSPQPYVGLNMDLYKTVIMVMPFQYYSCEELDILRRYINDGGRLFIVYEASPVFPGGPDYNQLLVNLPQVIVNSLLKALGSTLTVGVGAVDPELFPPGQDTGFVGQATPINTARVPFDSLCHGVGAPIFTNDALGNFEAAEYGVPGTPSNPPLVIGGFTGNLPALVPDFCP
jgi:hypothetical protein